jgi:hypothetical protein
MLVPLMPGSDHTAPGRRVRTPKKSTKRGLDSRQQSALLEREDCTLVTWYRSVYAPRTGGAYDSHYWTAGIVGRTRRSGRVAYRGAGAAAGSPPDCRGRSSDT